MATQVQGQGSTTLAFEVTSVKPSNPNPANPLSALPLILPSGAGRITASNTPLKNLVLSAYELQDFQLSGGPSWMRFPASQYVELAQAAAKRHLIRPR